MSSVVLLGMRLPTVYTSSPLNLSASWKRSMFPLDVWDCKLVTGAGVEGMEVAMAELLGSIAADVDGAPIFPSWKALGSNLKE